MSDQNQETKKDKTENTASADSKISDKSAPPTTTTSGDSEEKIITTDVNDDRLTFDKILKKRSHRGKVQYLVRWSVGPEPVDFENSWNDEDVIQKLYPTQLKEFNDKLNQDTTTKATTTPKTNTVKEKEKEKEKEEQANNEKDAKVVGKKRSAKDMEDTSKKGKKTSNQKKKRKTDTDESSNNNNNNTNQKNDNNIEDEVEEVGFKKGDKVENIVGARMIDNQLNLYVQWKGKNTCTFVPASQCNRIIPQKVIEFYESRIKFLNPLDNSTTS
eukprot:TRINITY_DN716_c4_g1_i1.p1 TRINITY_DN716_c4_g1~~TRINITY_DN716_c4_g1_i1.p1  ORF type:complete len:287 (-),score=95.47 TRINITY_DN716_c4_g1_i1:368-1183(-)